MIFILALPGIRRSMYFWRSSPPFMAQMGTLTVCLLYPSLSIWTTVTSSFLAVGIRTAVLISSLWLGFTLGPSFSSSSSDLGSRLAGSQVYSLLLPVRVQDQRYSSSTLFPARIAAILVGVGLVWWSVTCMS